jgi:hypothetical protein
MDGNRAIGENYTIAHHIFSDLIATTGLIRSQVRPLSPPPETFV